jgi:hypothetical protein
MGFKMSDCIKPYKRVIELFEPTDDESEPENIIIKYLSDLQEGTQKISVVMHMDKIYPATGAIDPSFSIWQDYRTPGAPAVDQLEATKAAISAMQDAVDLCEKAKAMLQEGKTPIDVKAELLRLQAGTDSFKQDIDRPRKRDIVIVDFDHDIVVVEGLVCLGKEDTIAFNKKHNDAFEIIVREPTPEERTYWLYAFKHQSPRIYDNTGLMRPTVPYPFT